MTRPDYAAGPRALYKPDGNEIMDSMNMILVEPDELSGGHRVRLEGRKALHIHRVLRAVVGDSLRVGLFGGRMGTGTVLSASEAVVEMDLVLNEEPPAAVGVTLALAMPRPKCFRRIIQAVVTLGVKRVAIFGAYRVEKSYWESPWLSEESLHAQVHLGLEQAMDTMPPLISLHRHFKPFVEDVLPGLSAGRRRLVAHPGATTACPAAVREPVTLVVGSEGGLTTYELERLAGLEFEQVAIGVRILRTEQVVPYLLGRLIPL
jgi:16S rRNA (uracil1498-N3)-methyltransferase